MQSFAFSTAGINLEGSIKVITIPSDVSFEEVLTSEGKTLIDGKNLIVSSASNIILGLLRRNFSDFEPRYITIGSGGDLEQVSGADSGTRVAPAVSDTAVRRVVARIPIVMVQTDSADSITFIGIAKPHEALSGSINEFGIESSNLTLFSHFITQPEVGETRARKYPKSSLEYLVVRWTIRLTLNS